MLRRALPLVLAALVIVPALAQDRIRLADLDVARRAVGAGAGAGGYFPERLDWQHKKPEEVGMNAALVNEAVQLAILLHVFPHVRVVPVDPRVRKAELISERSARGDRVLCHAGNAVEPVVEPDTVPVDRRGLIEPVVEDDRDAGTLSHDQQRTGILAVEPEHGVAPPRERAANHAGFVPGYLRP